MSGFTYAAGSTTPTDPAGLIEWPSARFSDGSLRPLIIPPLWESAPLRVTKSDLPGDGGYVPDPKLDAWEFEVKAWLLVDDTAGEDVQSALDYLRGKINAYLGWQDVLLRGFSADWTENRQMRLRLAGQLTADVPEKGTLMSPERDLTIPVIAADPRMYSTTLHSSPLNATLTNAGNTPAPLTVTFEGPLTNPRVDGPGTAGTNRIRLGRTLLTGESVTVTTYDPDSGQLTAIDDTGANAYGDITAATARTLDVGATAWTKTADAGAGTVTVEWRDAWA